MLTHASRMWLNKTPYIKAPIQTHCTSSPNFILTNQEGGIVSNATQDMRLMFFQIDGFGKYCFTFFMWLSKQDVQILGSSHTIALLQLLHLHSNLFVKRSMVSYLE